MVESRENNQSIEPEGNSVDIFNSPWVPHMGLVWGRLGQYVHVREHLTWY